ncbi:MAG: acyl carrier protein, partial [Thiomonas sp. 20-64-5]
MSDNQQKIRQYIDSNFLLGARDTSYSDTDS